MPRLTLPSRSWLARTAPRVLALALVGGYLVYSFSALDRHLMQRKHRLLGEMGGRRKMRIDDLSQVVANNAEKTDSNFLQSELVPNLRYVEKAPSPARYLDVRNVHGTPWLSFASVRGN